MGGLLYGATTLMAKSRFWVLLAAFQVAFGIAVFALTRDYYMRDQGSRIEPPNAAAGAPITWPEGMSESFAAQLGEEKGISLLVVTHDEDFAKRTDRILEMEDGKMIRGNH